MKPESLKHLQKMYQLCSEDMGYFKELIEAIIRIESETKTKSKFSLWDYTLKDDYLRPSMCCVLHDSGYKVASDAHIMVVLKEDYPEDMEGKQMKKDGTIETENVKFPNWRAVIPDPKKNEYVSVRLDFAGIRAFEADFKAKKKMDKRMEAYIRVGGCLFKLDYLIKAVRFMEHVGTDELMVSPDGKRAALAVAGDNRLIVMPVYPRSKGEWGENEICYGA